MTPPRLSRRATSISASPIRKFTPMIRAAEEKGTVFYKLHIGDPDLPTPLPFLKGIRGYAGKTVPYAPSSGIPGHSAAWVEYYANIGVKMPVSAIVPTVGATEAITMALQAVADNGDEVIIFEPFFVGFKGAAHLQGVKLVPVPLELKDGFALAGPEIIESRITPRTKAIIVINPDNPTGKVWTRAELGMLVDVAERHGLFIISDETYREIVFNGRPTCLLTLPRARQRTILIDSLSKRFSAPGARIGCAASLNPETAAALLTIAMARLAAPTIEQIAFIPLLKNAGTHVKRIVGEYKRRRDVVADALAAMPGITTNVPDGAFYAVAALPVDDAESFVRFLIEEFRDDGESVTVAPMKDFYVTPGRGENQVRIALVRDVKALRRAMTIFAKALASYPGRV